ncbi:hypothetical protein FTUN_7909 [Frigoriglobus tundricola]|uniref:Abasic site processing protein n=1 Tax=Frigoriglobus tundricola TaxID=2774151 RepID=A0A6M5Z491_9BACT|nr:hypothetical protein FTUN_7909 [Frigoriglobus tundricola]
MVPNWSNDGKPGPINAHAETVAGLSTFSDSFRERRCILPASGSYAWCVQGGKKRPHRFRLKGGGVMGFAGLWSKWKVDDKPAPFTCCLITTTANDVVRPFHDRTPAILAPDDYAAWLEAGTKPKAAHALLQPHPSELMEEAEANPLVNSPKNEGPHLLDPAA